jgi:hypothetical protein
VPDQVAPVYVHPEDRAVAFAAPNQFVPVSEVNDALAPFGATPVELADFTNDDPEANSKNVTTTG